LSSEGFDRSADRALAYLRVSGVGDYALVGPVEARGLPPRHFLVRMSPEAAERHAGELREAKARCVETRTGARFCLIEYDGRVLESMEMCNPIYEFRRIVEAREPPTIEECRKAEKNDFLVIRVEEKLGRAWG
jgi:hypothetical protein